MRGCVMRGRVCVLEGVWNSTCMKNGLYVVHCEDSGGCLVVCLSAFCLMSTCQDHHTRTLSPARP